MDGSLQKSLPKYVSGGSQNQSFVVPIAAAAAAAAAVATAVAVVVLVPVLALFVVDVFVSEGNNVLFGHNNKLFVFASIPGQQHVASSTADMTGIITFE